MDNIKNQLKELKLKGTILDRRRKLSPNQIQQLLDMYENKEKLGLTNKEIVNKFGVGINQIYRYKNYSEYLKRTNIYNKKYYAKKSKKERRDICFNRNLRTNLYKELLLEIRNLNKG